MALLSLHFGPFFRYIFKLTKDVFWSCLYFDELIGLLILTERFIFGPHCLQGDFEVICRKDLHTIPIQLIGNIKDLFIGYIIVPYIFDELKELLSIVFEVIMIDYLHAEGHLVEGLRVLDGWGYLQRVDMKWLISTTHSFVP